MTAPPARPRARATGSPASIDAWRKAAAASQERAFAARLDADRKARARLLLRRVLTGLLVVAVFVAAYVLVTGAVS